MQEEGLHDAAVLQDLGGLFRDAESRPRAGLRVGAHIRHHGHLVRSWPLDEGVDLLRKEASI